MILLLRAAYSGLTFYCHVGAAYMITSIRSSTCSAHRVIKILRDSKTKPETENILVLYNLYKQNDTTETALNNIILCNFGIDQSEDNSSSIGTTETDTKSKCMQKRTQWCSDMISG